MGSINSGRKPLTNRALTNDEKILVTRNLRLAYFLANKWSRRYPATARHIDDLKQQAVLGLMRAVTLFDPSRGVPFSAYAASWITSKLASGLCLKIVNAPGPVYSHSEAKCGGEYVDIMETSLVAKPDDTQRTEAKIDGKKAWGEVLDGNWARGRHRAVSQHVRDASIYLDIVFNRLSYREVGSKHGVTKQAIDLICAKLHPRFDAFAEKFRGAA